MPSAANRCARRCCGSNASISSRCTPRQGYRVNPISLADARDLLRFRFALEPACVAEAIESASDDILKSLNEFRLLRRQP